jgi:hypothetical protein
MHLPIAGYQILVMQHMLRPLGKVISHLVEWQAYQPIGHTFLGLVYRLEPSVPNHTLGKMDIWHSMPVSQLVYCGTCGASLPMGTLAD